MNCTLTKKIIRKKSVLIAMSGAVLSWFLITWTAISEPEPPESGWPFEIRKVFSEIADIIAFIIEQFALPVITCVILVTAIRWSWKNPRYRVGIYFGLGLFVSLICMDRLGMFPVLNEPLSGLSSSMILICWVLSFFLGVSFLWLAEKVAGKRIYSLFIGLMTVMSLSSFYWYYSSRSLEPYLFVMTPGIFVGACFYQILSKKT